MSIEDLKPIQRYDIYAESNDIESAYIEEFEGKDGEWCKWEDVEKVLDEVNKMLLDHLSGILKENSENLNKLDNKTN